MTQAATGELIISRVFDAPRALVYRAFVDPDQLAQWFGPVGYRVPRDTVQIDARPGGREHYVMMNQADQSVCHTIDSIFTEVVENEVLAGYQDAEGAPRLEFRMEFRDEPDGGTRLDLWGGPFSEQDRGETSQGWESSFTKLDKLLHAS